MIIDRLKGKIDFPEGGEGCYLSLQGKDAAELQKRFGPEWWSVCQDGLQKYNMDVVHACCEILGKKEDEKKFLLLFDNIEMAPAKRCEALIDGIYVAWHGMTFMEYLVDFQKKMRENGKGLESPS